MIVLEPAPVLSDGKLDLSKGEAAQAQLPKVDVEFEEVTDVGGTLTDQLQLGQVCLTTHRLIWVDVAARPSRGLSWALPLSAVQDCQPHSKPFAASRVKIFFRLEATNKPASPPAKALRVVFLKLVLNESSASRFADQLDRAVLQRAWVKSPLPAPTHGSPTSNPLASWADAIQQAPASPMSGSDQALVDQLAGMGFSRNRCIRAVAASGDAGPQAAVQWLFDNESDAALDAPVAAEPIALSQPHFSPLASAQLPLWAGRPAEPQCEPQLQPQPMPGTSGTTSLPPQQQQLRTGAAYVGVAGLLKREEQRTAATDRSLEVAFQDLAGLMTKAQEMVQLAERFRETQQRQHKAGGQETDGEAWMDREMELELINMGIASPVTRETAGARYHQELSRQLASFLLERLERAGGMMPLPDVYCLFNRARGTELVSPDDLLAAAKQFAGVGVPLRLRHFPSGVLVVQSTTHSDEQVCARVAQLVQGEGLGPAITASDVATALAVPLAIASEHLLTAEGKGVLCRDDGPEGLRFFHNFFSDAAVAV